MKVEKKKTAKGGGLAGNEGKGDRFISKTVGKKEKRIIDI